MKSLSVFDSIRFYDIREKECLIDYQPGNGTKYLLHFQHSDWPEATRKHFGIADNSTLVTWIGAGKSMWVSLTDTSLLHPCYVSEKLRCSEYEGRVLAEVIGTICGRRVIPCDHDEPNAVRFCASK